MLGVISPPKKPRGFVKTSRKPVYHYTLHSKPNDVFTLKPEENRTAIVAFNKWDDAFLLGQMMESYYIQQKEFPLFKADEMLILPGPTSKNSLTYLYLQQWNFEDLKVTCTKNVLDIITVENLKEILDGYSISGSVYKLEAPVDFYKIRFEELLPVNNDPDDGPY